LKLEILKLRQQQENSHVQLTNVQERVRSAEMKQYQMMFFLTRMAKRPAFVEQLIQNIRRKRELDGNDMAKRPRLMGNPCYVPFPNTMGTTPNVDYRHQTHQHQQFPSTQSDLNGFLSETVNINKMEHPTPSPLEDEICNPVQGLRAQGCSSANAADASSAYHVMSEKLMRENSVVDEELDVNDSNIYLELEDLITKPTDWSLGSASGLVQQTS